MEHNNESSIKAAESVTVTLGGGDSKLLEAILHRLNHIEERLDRIMATSQEMLNNGKTQDALLDQIIVLLG